MPIWEIASSTAPNQPQSISQRVRAGNALPILSHSALFDLALFGHESFKRFYAEKVGYPYPNLPDIGQLANYDRYTNRSSDGACKEFYLDCLKNHIFREARAAGGWPVARFGLAARHLGRFSGRSLVGHPLPDAPWLSRAVLRGRGAY